MRNQNSKVRVIKRKLSKCKDVCRSYSSLQLAYADELEANDEVLEFSCNVLLRDLELNGSYTTDFLITMKNGDMSVRECVERSKIAKPLNLKLLDASRSYWLHRGIHDWGLVIDGDT